MRRLAVFTVVLVAAIAIGVPVSGAASIYSTPSYSYSTPSYGYSTPSYSTPSYGYSTPSYTTPSYGYSTPSYSTPSYGYSSGSYYGQLNGAGFPKNQYVSPYVTKTGKYVGGYYRNSPSDGLPTCKIISC